MARPVLLVHGFGSSFAHGWAEVGWPDILADVGCEVIGVDLLGHGDAPKPHEPDAYTEGLADSVRAVLPDEPVDAIGFSLGAATLMRLAAVDISRFARLVLIGVGELTLRSGAAGGDAASLAEHSRVFAQLLDAPRNDRAALDACIRRPVQPFTPAELATITVPTLVVTSDADELAGGAQPLVDALPNATLLTLRGYDHFQTPREFACIDAAVRFLETA